MTIQDIIKEYMRGCSCGGPGVCGECADAAIRAIAINVQNRSAVMTDWIKWNGGECPIKSDKTRVEIKMRRCIDISWSYGHQFDWTHTDDGGDIVAYRIVEDHEPKMTQTCEQITAQIEALRKQLDAMPKPKRYYWNGRHMTSSQPAYDTHYFDIETINGVPHIHGIAMKEVGK